MKHVKCDKPERKRSYRRWLKVLMEFIESGDSYWRFDYEPGEYKSPESLRTTIRAAINRYDLRQIKEFIVDGVVYIKRKEL